MRIGKRSLDELARRWEKAAGNGAPIVREVHWDDELRGFGVRRQNDRSVSFVLKYRVKGDPRQRFLTLGEWPSVHPDSAREAARQVKEAAALGRDLVAEREVVAARLAAEAAELRRRAIPITEILNAWRATLEAERDRKAAAGISVVNERELLRLEARHLRPFVAGATVGSFDPDSLQALLDRQTGHSAALNLRTLIGRMARFARSWLLERGITVDWQRRYTVAQAKPPGRDHRYSLEEAARLWIAAGTLGRRGALVRFLLLTAGRRTECAGLRWSQIIFEHPTLGSHYELQAAHVKHKRTTRVPLSATAVALLRWLPPRETRRAGETDLVFAGRGNRPIGGWTDVRRALLRAARVPDGTLHDIRRTVVSTLGDHGWEPAVVDRLLNHAGSATMSGVMAVYQRSELWDQQRRALDAWTDLLMNEVAKASRKEPGPGSWGFTEPFQDARISRPRRPRRALSAAA